MRKMDFLVLLVLILGSFSFSFAGQEIKVKNIVCGDYNVYYTYPKRKILSVYAFSFVDWVGKLYAQKHNIDEVEMMKRAHEMAKSFAKGYAEGYLSTLFGKYNPNNYIVLIDNFNVKYNETEYKYIDVVSGNIIIFRK